jgi:glycosyltransferase involved in cell wall biosynthesis
MGKKIIYDFDDAIWIPHTTRENQLISTLKWHRKFSSICKWSYKICCCNDYLAAKAGAYNSNIVIMPTTLDTNKFVRASHGRHSKKITIGWTGTHSTLPYLTPVLNIIQKIIEQNSNVDFKVICNKRPNWRLPKVRYIEWNKETELVNLSDIDIGIMPLPESEWAKGKCGFKILQYFSMGIPAIASSVGINSKIIIHGENGYLCQDENDWKHYISLLVESKSLRDQLGRNARKTVESFYSLEANVTNFLGLFR